MNPGMPGSGDASTAQPLTEPAFRAAVALARDGSGPALERLYRWLAPDVARFAATQSIDDPEELTNRVFTIAFSQIRRFNGTHESFRAWIFAIARSELIARSPAGIGGGPRVADTDVRSGPENGEVGALDLLSLQRVTRLLSQLGEDQRDVVLLRMFGGLSLNQVSIIVDKPAETVKALQRQGLRRLQEAVLAEVVSQ